MAEFIGGAPLQDHPGADSRPIRVVTLYDKKGWAWWHRAHQIRRNLSPGFELEILENGTIFNAGDFDLVLLFEHYLLNMVPFAPREKVILGSSCPRLTNELLARLEREKCKAAILNNLAAYRETQGRARSFCCQNGVDEELFRPAPIRPSRPQVCWVGNSKSICNKGLDLVRAACDRVGVPLLAEDNARPGASVLTQEEVRDRVYHASTLYICASEFEGTPNTILEAMACGLPVVSTRVGNAPEIVRDGSNGFLVDRSVAGLAEGIESLLRLDPETLSRNARQSVLEGWTWRHRTRAYEAMFRELALEGRGLPARAPGPVSAAAPKPGPKPGFKGMVDVPFLAPREREIALVVADLKAQAAILERNPNDFDALLSAAVDSARLGEYKLARDFTSAASAQTRYYNEVIRDLTLNILCRERKAREGAARPDPAAVLGGGRIRVAMLTYNALDYTRQCLHSLLTRTRRPLEIHIRENASRDGTADWLRALGHPRVHVEYGAENLGVPGGRNRLIGMIREVASPEDFVVFLDNDIEVLEGWEDHFLEFFAAHPQVGIASAVGQRMVVEAAGRRLADPPQSDPAPVDVALGGYACWMRAPAMLSVGGYDENLGLFWHEDDDFCVRALGMGIDVWSVPGAPLIHHGHKSGTALSGLAQGGSPRNQAYLAAKWRKLGLVLPDGSIDRSAVAKRSTGGSGPAVPGPRAGGAGRLKILFQNRPGALTYPGGDTMVMERYRSALEDLGHTVDLHLSADAEYSRYDVVHLFNLVLPEVIEPMARNAIAAGRPVFVQALQENQTAYLGKAFVRARALTRYVRNGQTPGTRDGTLAAEPPAQSQATASSAAVAGTAAALFCNSRDERSYVLNLHPGARCRVVPYGVDPVLAEADPADFTRAFGVRDFLLCVGRLEVRKNQLSLLAALEQEDVDLVLADGGVAYFPEYAEACRSFRRRGRTIITGRLSPAMLASAYRAARAHILPSWQELPGLVTLEAAAYGCNVAATPHGGIREYMGEACAYFEPDDLSGIRAASLEAMRKPRDGSAAAAATRHTWAASAARILAAYQERPVPGGSFGERIRF